MEKHVVTLATMKGGSGKSTMAVCLAAHWWHTGRRVALIDADPQESVVRWRETGTTLKDLHCVSADGAGIASTIDDLLQRGFDRVVVDTPGFRSPVTDIAVGKAGLCLIPVRPSPVDFEVAADEVSKPKAHEQSRARQALKALPGCCSRVHACAHDCTGACVTITGRL